MKIKTRELYKLVAQTQPSKDSDLPKVRLIIYLKHPIDCPGDMYIATRCTFILLAGYIPKRPNCSAPLDARLPGRATNDVHE